MYLVTVVILQDATLQEVIVVKGKDEPTASRKAEKVFIEKIIDNSEEKITDLEEILDAGYFCNNDGWEFHISHPIVVDAV